MTKWVRYQRKCESIATIVHIVCTEKQLGQLYHVYLLQYSLLKIKETMFLPFDDNVQGLIWTCGIGDTAMKLTPLERAAQILLDTRRIAFETPVVQRLQRFPL